MGISTENTINFEIIIEHDGPLSLSILLDILPPVFDAVTGANRKQIDDIASLGPELAEAYAPEALRLLEENADRLVWLESVQEGSKKFAGRIWAVAIFASGVFCGSLADDVLERKEWYQQLVIYVDEGTDRLGKYIVDGFGAVFGPKQIPEGMKVKAVIVGDRVRIVVYPDKRHIDIASLRPSPRRS